MRHPFKTFYTSGEEVKFDTVNKFERERAAWHFGCKVLRHDADDFYGPTERLLHLFIAAAIVLPKSLEYRRLIDSFPVEIASKEVTPSIHLPETFIPTRTIEAVLPDSQLNMDLRTNVAFLTKAPVILVFMRDLDVAYQCGCDPRTHRS